MNASDTVPQRHKPSREERREAAEHVTMMDRSMKEKITASHAGELQSLIGCEDIFVRSGNNGR